MPSGYSFGDSPGVGVEVTPVTDLAHRMVKIAEREFGTRRQLKQSPEALRCIFVPRQRLQHITAVVKYPGEPRIQSKCLIVMPQSLVGALEAHIRAADVGMRLSIAWIEMQRTRDQVHGGVRIARLQSQYTEQMQRFGMVRFPPQNSAIQRFSALQLSLRMQRARLLQSVITMRLPSRRARGFQSSLSAVLAYRTPARARCEGEHCSESCSAQPVRARRAHCNVFEILCEQQCASYGSTRSGGRAAVNSHFSMSLEAALTLQQRGEFAAAEEVCRPLLTQQPFEP